ncbi:protein of unknown function [Cupriavidus taiwanensis]|uniref:Uncharacterized protein n=1 Tax=Cupriavidus taiwanensis TaxID=164546 RepID=A0A7Z7NLU9_9BURK|nr:protein of unknown function [Cupriavidus taiwanensis]SOZ04819.1 hypothetical protein CBM2597_A50771 [Cupriavidus taiwanensis]SPC09302.1 hypothetical protein CBM2594_A40625 [Cupriavidus taiwanensis]SPD39094.1 protein of unknown function [Cupriavidus taiwanensis]
MPHRRAGRARARLHHGATGRAADRLAARGRRRGLPDRRRRRARSCAQGPRQHPDPALQPDPAARHGARAAGRAAVPRVVRHAEPPLSSGLIPLISGHRRKAPRRDARHPARLPLPRLAEPAPPRAADPARRALRTAAGRRRRRRRSA